MSHGGKRPGSGRPKESRDRKYEKDVLARECREKMAEAISALVNALGEKSERVQAAKTLLEYGFGKPAQPVEHSGNILLDFYERFAGKTSGLPPVGAFGGEDAEPAVEAE